MIMNMTKIERPWVIVAHDKYYPYGGLNNIKAAFENEEDATKELEKHKHYDNYEVINIVEYINNLTGY